MATTEHRDVLRAAVADDPTKPTIEAVMWRAAPHFYAVAQRLEREEYEREEAERDARSAGR